MFESRFEGWVRINLEEVEKECFKLRDWGKKEFGMF